MIFTQNAFEIMFLQQFLDVFRYLLNSTKFLKYIPLDKMKAYSSPYCGLLPFETTSVSSQYGSSVSASSCSEEEVVEQFVVCKVRLCLGIFQYRTERSVQVNHLSVVLAFASTTAFSIPAAAGGVKEVRGEGHAFLYIQRAVYSES